MIEAIHYYQRSIEMFSGLEAEQFIAVKDKENLRLAVEKKRRLEQN